MFPCRLVRVGVLGFPPQTHLGSNIDVVDRNRRMTPEVRLLALSFIALLIHERSSRAGMP